MTPSPATATAVAPPGVRLDVRVGAGRATPYPLTDGGEFLVGGDERCQLVLPGSGVPAVVGRFVRLGDAVTFRRLDPAFPVLVNGELAGMNPRPLDAGDRVAVGPADLTLNRDGAHLHPAFYPFEQPAAEPADPLAAEREALAEQARELEADRILWYRRRQEMERELTAPPPDLEDTRRELEEIRRSLHQQFDDRRAQLAQMQEVIRTAAADLQDRRDRLGAELREREAARRAELDAEYAERLTPFTPPPSDRERELQDREDRLAAERDNFDRQRQDHADALVRLDRREAVAEQNQRQTAEIEERYEQLRRDARELEETVALAAAEREALAAEAARLGRQKADLQSHADKLAERSAAVEAQQATLAVLRATLDRRGEESRQEAAQLAADRARLDDAGRELDSRLHEAERLRTELATAEAGTAERERVASERAALLEATLAEIQQQKDTLAAEHERLRQKEADLDARSADTAEQTALLRGRLQQSLDLQARLEADRSAVREREVSLTDADVARQTFQEQLRRRADELTARSRHLDDAGRRLADQQAELDRLKADATTSRDDFAQRAAELAQRETALARQVHRLQEAGRATAAARKDLAATRTDWDAVRSAEATAHAARVAEFAALVQQAPALDAHAREATERLAAARELLRGQVGELHAFAGQTRGELEQVRAELRAEADRLTAREADHRLAVGEFRQQLLTWQATIADLKQSLGKRETTADARQAAAAEASAALAAQAAALEAERAAVADRRREVDRHLDDMRAWYQHKLRELAANSALSTQHSSLQFCRRLTRRANSSFPLAFRVLPAAKRDGMTALYAFFRATDDLADEPGEVYAKRLAVRAWRDRLGEALAGRYSHRVHAALHHAVGRFGIPPRHLFEVIDGVEMDLQPLRLETFADLEPYCYRVASAVGLACLPVWGVRGDATEPAVAAGIAFQLTNILRDVGEDLRRGRVYLPDEDIRKFDAPPEGWAADPAAFRRLMRFQADRARDFYRRAEPLDGLLTPDGRAVYGVMSGVYRRLLAEIERADFAVLDQRVRVPKRAKLALLLSAWPRKWGWL